MKVEVEGASAGSRRFRCRLEVYFDDCWGKRGRRIFQFFSLQGCPSGFSVVNTSRWERRWEGKRRREEDYVEHLVMWARQEDECQELREVTNYISERQEKLLAMMERKESLLSEAPGRLSKADLSGNQGTGRRKNSTWTK